MVLDSALRPRATGQLTRINTLVVFTRSLRSTVRVLVTLPSDAASVGITLATQILIMIS